MAVISRMILVPAILLPGVALVARYDSFEAAADPVFVVSHPNILDRGVSCRILDAS